MTRTAAIMQPTYLPYLGYFHLIAEADVFVFLDDVQFARRSWQQRNRILGHDGEVMLSVPVQKTDREAEIREIEIADAEPWRDKHLASVRHAYARRPHFADGMAFLEAEFGRSTTRLCDLNCGIIEGPPESWASPPNSSAPAPCARPSTARSTCWPSARPWTPPTTSRRWAPTTIWRTTACSLPPASRSASRASSRSPTRRAARRLSPTWPSSTRS
jgi:hypothetical protein